MGLVYDGFEKAAMIEASGVLLGQISEAGAAIAVNMGIRMEWGTIRRHFLCLLADNHTQAAARSARGSEFGAAARAVFGWGDQRHTSTNRKAEQASPPNPTINLS
jgi:hypothetical protein